MMVDNRISAIFVSAAFCLMIVTGVARIHHAKPIARFDRAPARMLEPARLAAPVPVEARPGACVRARDIPCEAA